jgi:hypothetical protein
MQTLASSLFRRNCDRLASRPGSVGVISLRPTRHFNRSGKPYHTSITGAPRDWDAIDISPMGTEAQRAYLAKVLEIADIARNLFFSADVGEPMATLSQIQLISAMTTLGILPKHITQIVCADKWIQTPGYGACLRRLLWAFPDLGCLLVVGGSTAQGLKLSAEDRYRAAKEIGEIARECGIPLGAVLNIYQPRADVLRDLELKRMNGVTTFFTQPLFWPLAKETQALVEDIILMPGLEVVVGVIELTRSLYYGRITEDNQSRSKLVGEGVVDAYPIPELTSTQADVLKNFNDSNILNIMKWGHERGLGRNNIYTRYRNGNIPIIETLEGSSFSFSTGKE